MMVELGSGLGGDYIAPAGLRFASFALSVSITVTMACHNVTGHMSQVTGR